MALDPIKAFTEFAEADCSVQFWIPDTPAVQFRSLRAAVIYARENGGRWNDIEITVHLPREDIVYGTEKVHRLIEALRVRSRR